MKIVVVGTRGIPEIQGGVETHCQELYPRLAASGHDVTVIRRSSYIDKSNKLSVYKGVKLLDVFAPRKKSFEAITHTFLAIIKARTLNPDLVHIHAIGPSIMAPFARLLGLRVVMTNHGPDYDRQKWGTVAKFILRMGERFGTLFSNEVIVISKVIKNLLEKKYNRSDTYLIYNGVNIPEKTANSDYIESIGLEKGKYIVALGRFVKEKGFHDLIDAYVRAMPTNYKLAIAGDADHPDDYSSHLKDMGKANGVILPGFIRGEKLAQLMSHAALYVMPSYHEGLPIALLEALSYSLDCVVSDIPANKLSCLDAKDFFQVGDVANLTEKILEKLSSPRQNREYDLTPFNWDSIAEQTLSVYHQALNKND